MGSRDIDLESAFKTIGAAQRAEIISFLGFESDASEKPKRSSAEISADSKSNSDRKTN